MSFNYKICSDLFKEPEHVLSILNLSFEKLPRTCGNVLRKFPQSKIKSSSRNNNKQSIIIATNLDFQTTLNKLVRITVIN